MFSLIQLFYHAVWFWKQLSSTIPRYDEAVIAHEDEALQSFQHVERTIMRQPAIVNHKRIKGVAGHKYAGLAEERTAPECAHPKCLGKADHP